MREDGSLSHASSLDDDATLMLRGVYCTIVAQNYLPQALTLYSSIRATEPHRDLVILVIDADRPDLESGRPRLNVLSTSVLGLTDRELDDLAMIYDVVEFSTSLKPLLLKHLLSTYEYAVYLDPDTFVVSPLVELEPLLDKWGIVLTPHFLEPIAPGGTYISEVHSLTAGVHNLGFCAVDRKGIPFLDWWWSHLERECLIYPLLGIFVDQKWTDIGATLFDAYSLRHYGYNAGPWNLHERSLDETHSGWIIRQTGEPLRLFHFSGFDPADPGAISVRLNFNMRDADVGSDALSRLSYRYARGLLDASNALGSSPRYGFERASDGKLLKTRTRRAYRRALVAQGRDHNLPSPFRVEEARAFKKWKRRSWPSRVGTSVADAAIAMKYAFPDEFNSFKRILPAQFVWLRKGLLRASRVRR